MNKTTIIYRFFHNFSVLCIQEGIQAATYLLKAIKEENQSTVDTLSATVSHVEYVLSPSKELVRNEIMLSDYMYLNDFHSCRLFPII